MKKQTFKKLISLAQQETAPSVNLAEDIVSSISTMTYTSVDPYRAYTWFGAASAAVAACILIAATMLWQTNSDSVNELITYVSWVTQ